MKTHLNDPHEGARRRSLWKGPLTVAAGFVAVLLTASSQTPDWHWHPAAFGVVGALVFCLGFVYQLVTRNRDALAYRVAVGISFGASFSLVWGSFVQMADVNPASAIYFGVPIVGIVGAALARLRPKGMARALFATALAQGIALTTVLTLRITRDPEMSSWTLPELRGVGGALFSALLFVGSALLFRKADRTESAARAGL